MPSQQSSLETRLRSVSKDLCRALEQVLTEALDAENSGASLASSQETPVRAVSQMRPVQLTHHLGLNKSLASRVVRAIYEEDELQALRGIPTPQGLQLIQRAAEARGATPPALLQLGEATGAYSAMLSEFTGGRTDLEATLAGWLPDLRVRAERDARRSVFRGMTTLAGTRTSAIYNSLYLIPNPDHPDRVDSVLVTVRQDVRRLQPDAEILIMRIVSELMEDWRKRTRTVDGAVIDSDPRQLLIGELCSHPIPKLDLDTSESGVVALRIPSDGLDVNELTTLGLGWRTQSHFPRFADEESGFCHVVLGAPNPVEALVLDLFVHKELKLASTPFTSLNKDRTPYPKRRSLPPSEESEQRRAGPPVMSLDGNPSGLASQAVRSCRAIFENVCREAGLDQEDFSKYRTRMEFPVITEELSLWWSLPTQK